MEIVIILYKLTPCDTQIVNGCWGSLFSWCAFSASSLKSREGTEMTFHDNNLLISSTCKIPVIPKCETMCRCTHEIVHTDPCFLNPRNAIPQTR